MFRLSMSMWCSRLSAICLPLAIAACSSTEPNPPRNTLVIVEGDAQRTVPGGQIPRPIVARVLGPDGQPLAGVNVQWTGSAGSEFEFREGLKFISDENGIVSRIWIVGYQEGAASHTATVTAEGLSPVTFTAESSEDALELSVEPDPLILHGIGDRGTVRLRVRAPDMGLDTLVKPTKWGTGPDWNATTDESTFDSDGIVLRATKLGSRVHWLTYGHHNVLYTIVVD